MRMGESHQQLLLCLKTVVEGLLTSQVVNVWNVYGGLSRLHFVLEKIFKHECSVFKQNGEEDCWVFIQALNWLRPNLASSPTPVASDSLSHPSHPHTDRAMIWLHDSLETHTLSEKLSWLLSDEQHLCSCYNPNAFLRQPEYSEATLICLRAVEQYQPSLLTEIHPSLYLSRRSLKGQEKSHRRCSSYPDTIERSSSMRTHKPPSRIQISRTSTELSSIVPQQKQDESSCQVLESCLCTSRVERYLEKERPWKSLPALNRLETDPMYLLDDMHSRRRSHSKTEPSSPAKQPVLELSPAILKVDYKDNLQHPTRRPGLRRASKKYDSIRESVEMSSSRLDKQRPTSLLQESTDTEMEHGMSMVRIHKPHTRVRKTHSLMNMARSPISPVNPLTRKKSFMEDGGTRSIQPMSTGFFPVPTKGQSLTSFLSSAQFAQANAELDRENAHFRICEGIISVIEQLKCNRWEQYADEIIEESDEEIQELKQRIRLRRKQKQQEKKRATWLMPFSDSTTTDQSFSPLSSTCSSGSSEDSLSTEGVDDLEVDKVTITNMEDIKNSGLSLSMASLYSEADLSRPLPSNCSDCVVSSAESVALSLLRRFSQKRLPRASDIEWLVTEKDAPQQLLPMPNSWAVSADDVEEEEMREASTPLRGTTQWAPPRPQIIFTVHPQPKRREVMRKQQFLCAGCGVKVLPEYANRFRYCDYLGRFFCTGCHSNNQALIPARILSKWDFNKYPVSDFSFNLLEQIHPDPLFSVVAINATLYKRVRMLERCRQLRLQLFSVKDFLITCRFATEQKEALQKEAYHMFTEPEKYSILDFVQVRSGELFRRLHQHMTQAIAHINNCQLCQARGFVCEFCKSPEVIYPWQLGKVNRCDACGACYHSVCLQAQLSCPRCLRIQARNKPEQDRTPS